MATYHTNEPYAVNSLGADRYGMTPKWGGVTDAQHVPHISKSAMKMCKAGTKMSACYEPIHTDNSASCSNTTMTRYAQACQHNPLRQNRPKPLSEDLWFTCYLKQNFRYPIGASKYNWDNRDDVKNGYWPCRKCQKSAHMSCANNDCILTQSPEDFVQATEGYGSTHTPGALACETGGGHAQNCTPLDPCISARVLGDINLKILGFPGADMQAWGPNDGTSNFDIFVKVTVQGPIETPEQLVKLMTDIPIFADDRIDRKKRNQMCANAMFAFRTDACGNAPDPPAPPKKMSKASLSTFSRVNAAKPPAPAKRTCPMIMITGGGTVNGVYDPELVTLMGEMRLLWAGDSKTRQTYDPDGTLMAAIDAQAKAYCANSKNLASLECSCLNRQVKGSPYASTYTAYAKLIDGTVQQGDQCWFVPCMGTTAQGAGYMVPYTMFSKCDPPTCETIVNMNHDQNINIKDWKQVISCTGPDKKPDPNKPDPDNPPDNPPDNGGGGGGGGGGGTGLGQTGMVAIGLGLLLLIVALLVFL